MNFVQLVLLKVPTLYLGIAIVAGAIALSIGGLITVRHFIPHHRMKLHNDVAGPLYGTVGVIYAVLLAFVVVVVWQNYDKSRLNVEKEANCLSDLYRDSESFAAPAREEIRFLCKLYGDTVRNEEWQTIQKGEGSVHVQEVIKKLWSIYKNYEPKTLSEKAFFEESVRKLNELCEMRRLRVLDSRAGLHPILWFVLVAGGLVTISFTFFFGSENLNAQITMTALLATLIVLILFTILLFDFPFTGDVSISADAFVELF